MKKKTVWIICAVLLIAAVIAVGLIVRSRQTAQEAAGAISLKANGQTRQIALKDLDREAFSGETVNGKGEHFSHDYSGISLKTLLADQKIDLAAVSSVSAVAADQFSASYTVDEINEEGKIYLAVQMDGKPIEGIEKGTAGVQMVVFGDSNSKRSVRNVSVIEVTP